MQPIKITREQEVCINYIEEPWFIVDNDKVVGIYESRDQARRAKSEDGLAGKIVKASSVEMEVEEIIRLEKRDVEVADVRALFGVADVMQSKVCPECGSEELYTGRNNKGLVVDEEYIIGCHHCDWEVDTRKTKCEVTHPHGNNSTTMKSSLKLDRTITCVETGETWKNAFQMWKAHPDWMTSAQQDRLTSVLYKAAKQGDQEVVKINDRHFQLVNVR